MLSIVLIYIIKTSSNIVNAADSNYKDEISVIHKYARFLYEENIDAVKKLSTPDSPLVDSDYKTKFAMKLIKKVDVNSLKIVHSKKEGNICLIYTIFNDDPYLKILFDLRNINGKWLVYYPNFSEMFGDPFAKE